MSDTDTVSVTRLIALVRDRPVLWDRQEEVYKNRKLTRQAWAEICEALIDNYHNLGEPERVAIGRSIIGKWANLRDNWLRYWRKRQELLRVGSSTKSLKKYIHHDQLLFLSKVYDPEGTQEVEEIQVEVDVISDPEFESTVEFDETSQNSWVTTQYQSTLLPQDQSERHLYFFHSLVPMICDFDDDQVLEFHSGVLDLIRRVKRRDCNSHSSLSTCVWKIQESNAGVHRIKTEVVSQSNSNFGNFTKHTRVEEEGEREVSCSKRSYVIPESTSTFNTPDEVIESTGNEVKQVIVCDKSEFVNLKDIVNKLEKLTGKLEAQVVGSQDFFEHNYSSLLAQLPPKKIQSLKRKMVKKMVREEFKRLKVEPTSRYIKTENKIKSHDSNPELLQALGEAERKVRIDSFDEEVSPSILRHTLQNLPLSHE